MFKAAVFDLDGTLLFSLQDLANASNYALGKMGLPTHDLESYKYYVGNGRTVLCRRILPAQLQTDENIARAIEYFDEYYSVHKYDCTKPYEGIIEMLDTLKSKGIKTAVVSNKPHKFTLPCINRYFGDKIDIACGSGFVSEALKPDPASVLYVMQKLCVDCDDTIYIGDSNVDMLTAANAKLQSCGVLWGYRTKEELLNAGADFIAETPAELCRIITGCF